MRFRLDWIIVIGTAPYQVPRQCLVISSKDTICVSVSNLESGWGGNSIVVSIHDEIVGNFSSESVSLNSI